MCVPGSKGHLSTAEHPPVLVWHRSQQKDLSRSGQEQVKDEGKHQKILVQVAQPVLALQDLQCQSLMVKITKEICHNIMKTKNNYNIAALILRPICLLALVPLGSDPPGFLCI